MSFDKILDLTAGGVYFQFLSYIYIAIINRLNQELVYYPGPFRSIDQTMRFSVSRTIQYYETLLGTTLKIPLLPPPSFPSGAAFS